MNKEMNKEYEPHFTVGLVLRCSLVDITKLKQFLDSSDINVVYQTTVGGDKRLIIKEQEVNSK